MGVLPAFIIGVSGPRDCFVPEEAWTWVCDFQRCVAGGLVSSFGFGGEYTGPLCLPNLENYPTALCYLILTPDTPSLPLMILRVTEEHGEAPWSILG